MTKRKLVFIACIAAIASMCLYAAKVSGQAPLSAAPPSAPSSLQLPLEAIATISRRGSEPVTALSRDGGLERVGLPPNQVVDVAVQYPVAKAGRCIVAEPLDGGKIIGSDAPVIDAEGMVYFRFQAGQEVGVYQVALHDGALELGLQFWVLDELHPEKNPALINSQN